MELFRHMLGIAGVFVLMGTALWWLRRKRLVAFRGLSTRKARRMEAVERLALSPHHSLHLVRAGERALLIGLHTGGCTLLESRSWQELDCKEARG